MAIRFIEHIGKGLLGFWEITETIEQLLHSLQPESEELERFKTLKNDRRKKEWLSARLLLQGMTDNQEKIGYDLSGKPHLKNKSGYISISHSAGCVVILLHPEDQPGIDIELITREVLQPAKKFLSASEMNDCRLDGQLSNKDVMLRWCAKEAVFKMVPYSDVDFAEQIACQTPPLTTQEGRLTATFKAADQCLEIPLHFRLIGEMLMVWGFLNSNISSKSDLKG